MTELQAHRRIGAYRVLERPLVYRVVQSLVGADHCRQLLARRVFQLQTGMSVLDVGCGPADLLAYLPRGIAYTGYDINEEYIQNAVLRFGDRGTFLVGAAGRIPDELASRRFDRITVIGLLHHLSDPEASRLLGDLAPLLAPNGFLVNVDPTLTDGQSWLARRIIGLDRGRMVRTPTGYRELLEGSFGEVHGEVRHDLLRIPYSHYIGKASRRAPVSR